MVTFFAWALGVLYGIVVAIALFGVMLYRRINDVLAHAEAVLQITEQHAKVADSRDERVISAVTRVGSDTVRAATVAASAAQAARQQAESATEKIIQKIEGGSAGDADKLPTVN